jgi:hypothetical protein
MNEVYAIQPVTVPGFNTTGTATKIMQAVNYTIGMTEMHVPYSLLNADDEVLWNGNVLIDSAELAAWGTDNDYMIDLVCTKAGVVRV